MSRATSRSTSRSRSPLRQLTDAFSQLVLRNYSRTPYFAAPSLPKAAPTEPGWTNYDPTNIAAPEPGWTHYGSNWIQSSWQNFNTDNKEYGQWKQFNERWWLWKDGQWWTKWLHFKEDKVSGNTWWSWSEWQTRSPVAVSPAGIDSSLPSTSEGGFRF